MRLMSFALTTEQVRRRQKTVTRRLGWRFLKPGTLLQPVVKCQGIPKGGTVEKIGGPVRVKRVTRERLSALLADDEWACSEVVDEGFGHLSPPEFVTMFCEHNGCKPGTYVTRIEFEYVEG